MKLSELIKSLQEVAPAGIDPEVYITIDADTASVESVDYDEYLGNGVGFKEVYISNF